MQLINNVIADINSTKEKILRELIEKIEGRPFTLQDVENLILAKHPPHPKRTRERVIYRDVQLGDIEVDIEDMVVRFIPIAELCGLETTSDDQLGNPGQCKSYL